MLYSPYMLVESNLESNGRPNALGKKLIGLANHQIYQKIQDLFNNSKNSYITAVRELLKSAKISGERIEYCNNLLYRNIIEWKAVWCCPEYKPGGRIKNLSCSEYLSSQTTQPKRNLSATSSVHGSQNFFSYNKDSLHDPPNEDSRFALTNAGVPFCTRIEDGISNFQDICDSLPLQNSDAAFYTPDVRASFPMLETVASESQSGLPLRMIKNTRSLVQLPGVKFEDNHCLLNSSHKGKNSTRENLELSNQGNGAHLLPAFLRDSSDSQTSCFSVQLNKSSHREAATPSGMKLENLFKEENNCDDLPHDITPETSNFITFTPNSSPSKPEEELSSDYHEKIMDFFRNLENCNCEATNESEFPKNSGDVSSVTTYKKNPESNKASKNIIDVVDAASTKAGSQRTSIETSISSEDGVNETLGSSSKPEYEATVYFRLIHRITELRQTCSGSFNSNEYYINEYYKFLDIPTDKQVTCLQILNIIDNLLKELISSYLKIILNIGKGLYTLASGIVEDQLYQAIELLKQVCIACCEHSKQEMMRKNTLSSLFDYRLHEKREESSLLKVAEGYSALILNSLISKC